MKGEEIDPKGEDIRSIVPKFVGQMEKHRDNVGMSRTERPWTDRQGAMSQGCRRQTLCISGPLFMSECMDIRWFKMCKANQVNPYMSESDFPPGFECWTDLRQHPTRQKRNGKITVMCGSVVYNHLPLKRVALTEEHYCFLGWPDGLNLDRLGDPPPHAQLELEAENAGAAPGGKKRRKLQKKSIEACNRSLAGSGIMLGDLATLLGASLAAGDFDIWSNESHAIDHLLSSALTSASTDYRVVHSVIDPNDTSDLQRTMQSLGVESEDEGEAFADAVDCDDID